MLKVYIHLLCVIIANEPVNTFLQPVVDIGQKTKITYLKSQIPKINPRTMCYIKPVGTLFQQWPYRI